MTTKDKVYQLLEKREWVSVEELEQLFPPRSEGHMSFMQRLRQIRAELLPLGGNVTKRRKFEHTFEYHLIKPEQNGQIKWF